MTRHAKYTPPSPAAPVRYRLELPVRRPGSETERLTLPVDLPPGKRPDELTPDEVRDVLRRALAG